MGKDRTEDRQSRPVTLVVTRKDLQLLRDSVEQALSAKTMLVDLGQRFGGASTERLMDEASELASLWADLELA